MKRHPACALAALVGASFVIRTAVSWLRATPALFPDEYIYSAIGRSLADSGRPLIRGGSAHFPALLQPIVTAPAWLIGDVEIAFRVVQAIGALAMSLAAVPVYVIAGRLGLSRRVGLALSALAVLVPDLVYASFLTSEPFAYPLVLGAVAAAVAALTQPTRRAQLTFVVLAGLSALARAQFVVLPVVFLLAVLGLGMAERRTRAALREQVAPLSLFVLPGLALLLAGPGRVIGFYDRAFHLHVHPVSFLRWAGWDCMALAYASGWIVLPGALIGLWLALRRPLSREERAFGLTVALFAAVLIVEVGLFQTSSNGPGATLPTEIKERYVFYLVPLIGLCFALYAKRGWPARLPHLALAAALLVLSVRVPLSGFAVTATINASPILFGVHWLSGELGGAGNGAGVVAAAVGLMSVVAVLASRRPRIGTPVVLSTALLATGAASAGAVALDVNSTSNLRKATLPSDPSWVDRAHVGQVTLLQSSHGARGTALQELFWNRSITQVALLPGAARFDVFRTQSVRVSDDGSLSVNGRPLGGPLLVDTFGSTVRLWGAREIESGPTATLWVPDRSDQPRLRLYAPGVYHDGWLASAGAVYLWPERAGGTLSGSLSMRLTASRAVGATKLTFTLPNHRRVAVRLVPGTWEDVRLPVCVTGSAHVAYRSNVRAIAGLRMVSATTTSPVFISDRTACPQRSLPSQPAT